jgi:flagellar motor switch protein FliG
MSLPVEPSPITTQQASRFEQAILAGVPRAKHAELVALLRSPDPAVREIALVLIQLDREEAARRAARRRPRGVAQGW